MFCGIGDVMLCATILAKVGEGKIVGNAASALGVRPDTGSDHVW